MIEPLQSKLLLLLMFSSRALVALLQKPPFTSSRYKITLPRKIKSQLCEKSQNKSIEEKLSSLYSSEELLSVLKTHLELKNELITKEKMEESEGEKNKESLSIHDLVQMNSESNHPDKEGILSPVLRTKSKNIRIIASDVDGTLLTSNQSVHHRAASSIRKVMDEHPSKSIFLATGKSKSGALTSIGPDMASLLRDGLPGVYIQGLYCLDGQGKVVFEKKLTPAAFDAVLDLALIKEVSLVAYDGDQLYTNQVTPIVEHLHTNYGEPLAQPLDNKEYHKVLLLHNDTMKIAELRPQLERLANQFDATVTQALPTMLELLPSGCSKALGVSKLCESLGIVPEKELLALGDAENDVGMLRMASIGVAMGNACPSAKEASDYVIPQTNDEGGVGAAIELFLLDKNKT